MIVTKRWRGSECSLGNLMEVTGSMTLGSLGTTVIAINSTVTNHWEQRLHVICCGLALSKQKEADGALPAILTPMSLLSTNFQCWQRCQWLIDVCHNAGCIDSVTLKGWLMHSMDSRHSSKTADVNLLPRLPDGFRIDDTTWLHHSRLPLASGTKVRWWG